MPILKRYELYDAVWSGPMGPLSRTLDMNSARLRALCKRMVIPLPPVDYFIRMKEGVVGPRTELRPHDGPDECSTAPNPKQSLADWVRENRAESLRSAAPKKVVQKPTPVEPTAAASTSKPSPRYITLNEWAVSQFSRPPHYNTLIRWVHDGRIQPQPKKIGRAWQVRPHAEYVCD
jgi:hypothetical protein